jgi:hypothetical protein
LDTIPYNGHLTKKDMVWLHLGVLMLGLGQSGWPNIIKTLEYALVSRNLWGSHDLPNIITNLCHFYDLCLYTILLVGPSKTQFKSVMNECFTKSLVLFFTHLSGTQ